MELPDEPSAEAIQDAKAEFEFDGAAAVFSTWWELQEDSPVKIDATMTDERAAALLAEFRRTEFLEGEFLFRLKFLREQNEGDWVVENKFDPVRTEEGKDEAVVEISDDTQPGLLTGIDLVYYQNAYPVTAVVYGLYPISPPGPTNLAPLEIAISAAWFKESWITSRVPWDDMG